MYEYIDWLSFIFLSFLLHFIFLQDDANEAITVRALRHRGIPLLAIISDGGRQRVDSDEMMRAIFAR